MPAQIIDGNEIGQGIITSLRETVEDMHINPHLAVVLIGDKEESETYIRIKKKRAEESGMMFTVYRLADTISSEEVIKTIHFLNNDSEVHGIIVQLPLPKQFDTQTILEEIDPSKDVDCLNPITIEKYLHSTETFTPPLAGALIKALEYTQETFEGKKALIIAKNESISKVLSFALSGFAIPTDTILINTKADLNDAIVNDYDIVVTITGIPHIITNDLIRDEMIVIDMSFIKQLDGKITSDTDWEELAHTAKWITPVPGGIGPITVALLLKNTVDAASLVK